MLVTEKLLVFVESQEQVQQSKNSDLGLAQVTEASYDSDIIVSNLHVNERNKEKQFQESTHLHHEKRSRRTMAV